MIRYPSILLIFAFLSNLAYAQTSSLTLLCLAAHPDDEDGAALVYYSKIKGYKSYTIFYTRGEGGQNEIGPELNEELGKIREQECYKAALIQASTAYFLGFLDFGYSKTAKETFKFWGGKNSVLTRIVFMIRALRPDVVISNHDTITTEPNRQHGNHQAVGITMYEAFEKAADSNFHPEQLVDGITPWQIKKLYFRVYDSAKTSRIFTLDINQKDASGKTILETAIDALNQHKTQGMDKLDWKNIPGISKRRRYELVRSDKMYPPDGDDLFEGLVQSPKLSGKDELTSYPTFYSYKNIDPEDSIRILKSVRYEKDYKIGLVKTYDNSIQTVFNAFGVKYDTLTEQSLDAGDLSLYQTIILDIRTYLIRRDAEKLNARLLEYANNGGNIICFYNKPQDWNGKFISPYPIYITSERVTEEDASVTVLEPNHDFFTKPNPINENDWNGWVQERNIYLPSDDPVKTSHKYIKLLAMHDEDDPVPSTSLLYTMYGKGTYTYCSLALFRQLKIFNEGALKLLMNMISQPDYFSRILKEHF